MESSTKASGSFEGKPDRRRPPGGADAGLKLFDREPPASVHAERSLLGSMLLDPQVIPDILPFVNTGEAFFLEGHAAIFQALIEIYDKRQSGDLVQLAEALRARGVLDQVGGTKYLVQLAEAVPSAANAPHYARIVSDRARLRKLINAAGEILYDAYHADDSSPEGGKGVVDIAERRIFEIAEEEQTGESEALFDLVEAEIKRLEQADGSAINGIATGFEDLDKLLGGLQKGEMLILAARPSMGKTAISLNIAEQAAFGGVTPWSPPTNRRVPIGYFSLEMSAEGLTQRLISARSGVDAHKIRTGAISPSELEEVTRACQELSEAPLHIDDTPALSILALRARARRMKRKHHIEALVIDYLQLLTSPSAGRESRQVEVSAISRGIKALARELEIPIVCLAQLNRGAEQRERNRPRMSDLRESGSIEQDADVVMLLHREAYYHKDDEEWLNDPDNADKLNLTELIIAKQRNGPTGVVKLSWDDKTTRFKNYDWRHAGDEFGGGYASPSEAASFGAPPPPSFAPAPPPPPSAPPPPPPGGGYTFAPGKKTGPVEKFRDGSGNDVDFDDDELPPF
ncbi:MAG: replicative DNA helicase [Phycisphaerales bacterium JB059]